jgi:ABC-2 type transport system ATP-binding protein
VPDAGQVSVGGYDPVTEPDAVRALLGWSPDVFGVYDNLTTREYLEFFAAAYRLPRSTWPEVVGGLLELVDLSSKRDSMVNSLSRGMKQRLSLARALVHDPELLILDEPASGLDPRARYELRSLLLQLKDMGKTIVISSHILPELADLCNTVGIIEQGELLYSGPVADIVKRARVGTVLHVSVAKNQEQAAALLATSPQIESVNANNGFLQVALKTGISDYTFVPKQLVSAGYQLTLLKEEEVNLETAFMRLTKGMVQ